MNVLVDLPEIEGFEYTGEYRVPKDGEWFLDGTNNPYKYSGTFEMLSPLPIIKKKAPKYKKFKPSYDHSLEYVEIQALIDALELTHINARYWKHEHSATRYLLKELIK